MKPLKSILALAALALLAACKKDEVLIQSPSDVNRPEVRIGIMTGSTAEGLSKARFPKAQLNSFDDIMDAVTALKAKQVDVAITAFPQALQLAKTNPDLLMVPERLDHEPTAAAVRQGNTALLDELNVMVAALRADGTLADMEKRWFKPDLAPYVEAELDVPTTGTPLKVGVAATREPASFVDKNGKVSGFDSEIARRFAARVKRPIEFVNMKFSALIPALQSGKIDLIVTGMSATPERRKFVDFSEAYFDNALMLVVRKPASGAAAAAAAPKGLNLAKVADAEDKRVAVLLGSAHEAHVTRNWSKAEAVTYQTFSDMLLAVRTGKADVGLCDTAIVEEAVLKDPELAMFGETLLPFGLGVGFNKQSAALRDQFATFLAALEADGTLADMRKRWITDHGQDMPQLPAPPAGKPMVVGTSSDGLPFEAIVKGQLAGFDIEMMERFGRKIGRPVRFESMPFGSLVAAVSAGKVDAIAASIFITEERKKLIDFSPAYHQATSSLFARKQNIEGAAAPAPTAAAKGSMSSFEDAKSRRIAVVAGSAHETYLAKVWPDTPVQQYHTVADMLMAVRSSKAEVGFSDTDTLKQAISPEGELVMFGGDQIPFDRGIGFAKGNTALRAEFDSFLDALEADGTLADMRKRWIEDRARALPTLPPAPAGKPLVVGTADIGLPFDGVVDNKPVGFDVELLERFGRKIGRPIRFDSMMFGSIAPALASGKIDVIGVSIYITEERKKSIEFSKPDHKATSRLFALRKQVAGAESAPPVAAKNGFWSRTAESFKANILTENRYLLLWDGLKITVLISVLSTLFGTLLGAGICMMRLSRRKLLNVPAKAYIGLLRGLPVLVLLMLIFYVIFASVDIPPVLVAVIAFGMNFGAYAAEIFRSGIEGIDKGQTEAGLAMGFTRVKTFLHIVLPQMVRRVLPVYKGEFISMIKMTSIVGYIAVQDLTKASDIIRSRTFDAFFPLVMVAVLYFLIAWLLVQLLELLERRMDPRSRRQGASR